MSWTKNTILLTVAGFLLGFALILMTGFYKNSKMYPLEVSFLDVGQGDAILINYLHRYQILIDSGSSGKKVLAELAEVMPFKDEKIEVIIITHPDRDHFAGFIDVVKKYNIGLVIDNGQKSDDKIWQELSRIIKVKNIPRQVALEGSTLQINNRIKMKFFNPDKIEKNKKAKNDSSIVTRLDYLKNSFLFTGDAGFDSEADMIFDKEDLNVDWLKAGHHGSKNSGSDFFLARVTPKWSIISVGENEYGHPTNEAMDKLQKVGSKILRTDQLGTITVQCDKKCLVK